VGKTSLIETLEGRRSLAAGKIRTGHNVKLGYLSQHADELEWGGARTVLEAAQKQTGLSPNQARALLGRFLFSGEDAEKPLDGLSGGERRRLSLAILVASDANVLILDEPTNHLDLESREALEDALQSFPGSLLLVSHDRALLDAVGSRTVAIEDYTLHSYVGGWPEYWRVREERKAAGATPPPPPAPATNGHGDKPPAEKPPPVPKPKGPSKNAQRRQTELEQAVEQAEAELAKLEDELADPAAWATKYESAKSTARHTAAKRAVEAAYAALAEHEESVAAP
jgi:ATP-binding cassette, subfamily F, member 3